MVSVAGASLENLQRWAEAELAKKSGTGHGHAQGDIAGLAAALAGKAAASHSHSQAQVSGLADALSMKMPVQTVYYNGDDYDTAGKGHLDTMTDALALVPIGVGRNEALFTALGGGGFAYVMQLFYTWPSATARRAQIAMSYDTSIPHMAIRSYTASGWTAWRRLFQTNDFVAVRSGARRTISVPTTGWSYQSGDDRYSRDISVSGVEAGMAAHVLCLNLGGSFPLLGVYPRDGKITVYMADIPTLERTIYVDFFKFV